MLTEKTQGRFPNISNYKYHNEIPWAYSNSDLIAFDLSPSNLQQKRHGPKRETDALEFGQALHARLEFHDNESEFLKRVAIMPPLDRRTKEGKEKYAQFMLESVNKTVIDSKEALMIHEIFQAMEAHPDANQIMKALGTKEETFIWQDEDSGVWCRCRPDKFIENAPLGMPIGSLIVDWKTCASVNEYDIRKSIMEYNYHMQAAFYKDGISAVLGRDAGEFINCFIEKASGHRVVLGAIGEDSLRIGRKKYKSILSQIADCEKNNSWPGFVDYELPAWAMEL